MAACTSLAAMGSRALPGLAPIICTHYSRPVPRWHSTRAPPLACHPSPATPRLPPLACHPSPGTPRLPPLGVEHGWRRGFLGMAVHGGRVSHMTHVLCVGWLVWCSGSRADSRHRAGPCAQGGSVWVRAACDAWSATHQRPNAKNAAPWSSRAAPDHHPRARDLLWSRTHRGAHSCVRGGEQARAR